MRTLIFSLFFLLAMFFPQSVSAAKKISRSQVSAPVTSSAWSTLRLRSDHKSLWISLGGMQHASTVTYTLTYTADGVGQGVQGSHTPSDGNIIKEILFGTCSGAVCSYHQNITDMVFEISLGLNSGGTIVRRYAITP